MWDWDVLHYLWNAFRGESPAKTEAVNPAIPERLVTHHYKPRKRSRVKFSAGSKVVSTVTGYCGGIRRLGDVKVRGVVSRLSASGYCYWIQFEGYPGEMPRGIGEVRRDPKSNRRRKNNR